MKYAQFMTHSGVPVTPVWLRETAGRLGNTRLYYTLSYLQYKLSTRLHFTLFYLQYRLSTSSDFEIYLRNDNFGDIC